MFDPGLLAEPFDVFAFDVEPAEPEQSGEVVLMPGRGTFFDEFIEIRNPEGMALVEQVLAVFDEVRPRQRKRNQAAQSNHTERICRLLANAMRAHFFRVLPSVLYFRKADAEWYEDSPSWMRHGALGEAVDALADAGLFRTITGRKMQDGSVTPSSASSYAPAEALIGIALECGITAQSIRRSIPAEELVRLFGPKPQPEFDWTKGGLVQPRKGKRITFEPTAETAEWTATLAAINAFYRLQDISLGLAPEQLDFWLTERNADPDRTGTPYRLPETFGTDIYRVFNNGDQDNPRFGQGGRMFGGWWMHISEGLREAITINGQSTVELDYGNCHPRMLYAERGLNCDGDLYALPEIGDNFRRLVKWAMQVLINGKRRPNEKELPDHLALPPGFTLREIVALLEARHQPIADAFKTGAGLRLMRLESDIALEIVTTAMAEGWVALSVHDSFITTVNKRDRLEELMNQAHFHRFGMNPDIN
ncbi:hypothetical protein LWE61_03285 [Sphingobium sufflavum]|nr:hypothetical protein [Sphingobium sufflavum]